MQGRILSRAFDEAPIAMALVTLDGGWERANRALRAIVGLTRRQLDELRMQDVVDPADADAHAELLRGLLAGERHSAERELRWLDGRGRVVWVKLSVALLRDDAGAPLQFIVQAQDVTAGRQAAEAARAARDRFEGMLETAPDAIVVVDERGEIVLVNAQTEALFGYDRDKLLGRPVEILLPDAVRAGHVMRRDGYIKRAHARAMGAGLDLLARHRDGRAFPVEISLSPLQTDDGLLISSAIRDVSEHRRIESAVRRLAAIVESSEDAIIGKTLDGEITSWNPAAERMYGYTAQEALGKPIAMLLPAGAEDELAKLLADLREGRGVTHHETRRRTKDGRVIEVSVTASPIKDAQGRVIGASTVARDIGAQKRAERAREQALGDLEEAQQIARLGSWTWDPTHGKATWSVTMHEIFGRNPEDGPALDDSFLAYVHPDDRDRLAAGYAQTFGGGPAFELDYRIIDGRGVERMLHTLGRSDPDRPGCFSGTVQDATERYAAERALRDAEERFRRAFDDAPIGMALIRLDGRIEQANAALGVICGRTRHELEDTQLRHLLHPADVEAGQAALSALTSGETDERAVELRFMPVTGSALDVSVHSAVLRDAAGNPTRILAQFQDVTDRNRFEAQLQFMADHDPLTGLLNRRKLEAELDRHVAHVKRYGAEGALIVLDIDHFKPINDTLGHSAGDELIVSIAGVLRERLRESDVLARLGGDEFAVLLPKAGAAEAEHVAQALVHAVRTSSTLVGGEARKVTTSVGVTMFDAGVQELSSETVLVEADLAMYDAKDAGRDRYAFYSSSDHRINRTRARLTWANRIEHALANDRFTLVAQPILDLRAREVRRYELLLRMLDEQDDLIPPATFLAIAERFGMIARLDEWVATRAIELIEQRPALQLEVNISGRSLGDPGLLSAIDRRLRASPIDPAHLIFEVTETAAVANVAEAQGFARHLRALGCRFALDDFGAGFGSFYYLKHLPFDYVKIDGEFVQHATTGHIDRLVIEAVVRIAQGLGKETIAEFVTDETTLRRVQQLGVDYAQGHHIGRPAPVADLLGDTTRSEGA